MTAYKFTFYLLNSICLFFLAACANESKPESSNSNNQVNTELVNQNIEIYEAKNFSIQKQDGYTLLQINQADANQSNSISYVLYPKTSEKPRGQFPSNSIFIPTPVEQIMCTGTAQIALLDHLGQTDKIIASTNSQYVYNPTVQKGLEEGRIKDLGKDGAIDHEAVIMAEPDLILAFKNGNTKDYKRFQDLGIPVLFIAEYLEKTPLGRAEWIRFLAPLFGKSVENKAEQSYLAIANEYQELIKLVAQQTQKPSVFTGIDYQGAWYVAGGKSFIAQWIQDAGGDYIWKNNEQTGGVQLDIEAVYDKVLDADIWLNVLTVDSREALETKDARYTKIKAFQDEKIFSYTKRISEKGGYDFFESTIPQPQLVLKDLIRIFHPDLLPEHELYYYEQLK